MSDYRDLSNLVRIHDLSINSFIRNLLRPTGVGLQEAVFTLRVYRAEDLPQSKLLFRISSFSFSSFLYLFKSKANCILNYPA